MQNERIMPIKILRTAGDIPDKAEVTKKCGNKPYILRRRIEIYAKGLEADVIVPPDRHIYLIADGTVNIIREETELIFATTLEQLLAERDRDGQLVTEWKARAEWKPLQENENDQEK